MTGFVLLLLLGLQIKHFIADYLLQFKWMIAGKGSLTMTGGYAHAGIHALGTFILFLFFPFTLAQILLFVVAEFIVHFLLDFAKVHYGDHVSSDERPRAFWALNGLDQLLHHLTYIAMAYFAVQVVG